MYMTTDPNLIVSVTEQLLKNHHIRKNGLSELEKLTIFSVAQNSTYKQASISHQYTESSFQNAAARLFKDLSRATGELVNRRNFINSIEKNWAVIQKESGTQDILFSHLQIDLWICAEHAVLAAIAYSTNKELDITDYLIQFSPRFDATFCLEVSPQSSPIDLLRRLCNTLQLLQPNPQAPLPELLKSISLALKKQSNLLVLCFDQPLPGIAKEHQQEYAEIFATLSLQCSKSCLLILDPVLSCNEPELEYSLAYQIRTAMQPQHDKKKGSGLRLISIANDRQIAHEILQTYLRSP